MRFRTTIEQSGKTATGIQVPEDIIQALGAGNGQVSVPADFAAALGRRQGQRGWRPGGGAQGAVPGVGWLAYATDPNGLIFGIHQPDRQAR